MMWRMEVHKVHQQHNLCERNTCMREYNKQCGLFFPSVCLGMCDQLSKLTFESTMSRIMLCTQTTFLIASKQEGKPSCLFIMKSIMLPSVQTVHKQHPFWVINKCLFGKKKNIHVTRCFCKLCIPFVKKYNRTSYKIAYIYINIVTIENIGLLMQMHFNDRCQFVKFTLNPFSLLKIC